jgi:hypothetical protein
VLLSSSYFVYLRTDGNVIDSVKEIVVQIGSHSKFSDIVQNLDSMYHFYSKNVDLMDGIQNCLARLIEHTSTRLGSGLHGTRAFSFLSQ